MLKRIKNLSYKEIKNSNTANIKWSDLIFGGTLVTIWENTAENTKDDAKTKLYRTFVNVDDDERKYREIQAAKFVLGDDSMLTNYRPAKLLRADGSVVHGLSYTGPGNKLQGHGRQVFEEMSAALISEAAESEGIKIIYSENAVRQLSNIRIMDTLFGRKTRNLDLLRYNAATQIVFGEPRIVISSVIAKDTDYFGDKAGIEEAGERVRNVSVLGEDGKLCIGAYDRKVADRFNAYHRFAVCHTDCEDMEITGEPAKKVITLHAFTVDNAQGKPDEFYGYFGSAFEREVERFIDMWTGDEK
jgi:hypothetical protein